MENPHPQAIYTSRVKSPCLRSFLTPAPVSSILTSNPPLTNVNLASKESSGMTNRGANILQAYTVKLTTSDGKSVTFPRNLLTSDQAERIAKDLQALALQSGMGQVRVDVSPVRLDDRESVLDQARSFFSSEGQPKPLAAFQVAVRCVSCQTIMPLDEALSSSQQAAQFLSGDPIAGESRCEQCPRHSVENCNECRTEWLISNSQDFRFVCECCRAQTS